MEQTEDQVELKAQPEAPVEEFAVPPALPEVVEPVQPAPEAPEAPGRIDKYSLKGNMAPDAEHKRKLQGLELQRERILSERTASAHRRSALANALADVEEQLAQLGWTIHL